jgi:hypothetical protein
MKTGLRAGFFIATAIPSPRNKNRDEKKPARRPVLMKQC